MKSFFFIALIGIGLSPSVRADKRVTVNLEIKNDSNHDVLIKLDDPNPVCFVIQQSDINHVISKKTSKIISISYSTDEYNRMSGDCDMDISFCTQGAENFCSENDFELDLLDGCLFANEDVYNNQTPIHYSLGNKDCTGNPRKTQVTFTNNSKLKKHTLTQKAQVPEKHKP
ncbi:hypothetical protein Bealeia1_00219 [Candidatus Bealeia paramacronuclearis]|uniref:Uncharacterized protein n=1 Tax=Candidatus Bealeia paramacronuclearis TaxID=1921001 RepID=A0ABZ2C1T0_9PROT|nr:hypothetical protein [Candidatus Bealeia paramacronuclearis]